MMTKRQRIETVLAGEVPDKIPISLWYHFGTQHEPGDIIARLALEFFRYYDLDWLKVMNDYPYPLPEGLETIESESDLNKIISFNLIPPGWTEQLKAIKKIDRELKQSAFFVDTIFDSWTTFQRMAGENTKILLKKHPKKVLLALENITNNLELYAQESLRSGSNGIFLSVAADKNLFDRESFNTFVRPFNIKLLSSIKNDNLMNIAHIHGNNVHFDQILDYPVQIFNWFDRAVETPNLSDIKQEISGIVMGGIDHSILHSLSVPRIRKHVHEAIKLGGTERFLMSGGCSISTDTPSDHINATVEAIKTQP